MRGEFALIERIKALLPPARGFLGIGDDTAVLPRPPGKLLFTCDALVEGVHFRREHGPLEDVGWKALAVNLSDVAAMGGRPGYALVALGIPPGAREEDALALYRGLAELAAAAQVQVVGGNVTRAPVWWVDVALLAEAPSRPPLRSRARPGQRVLLTGELGAAAAGLALLERRPQPGLDPDLAAAAVAAYRRPRPRLRAGRALAERNLAAAMIDVSDGLAADLSHIAASSGVGIAIHAERLPISRAAQAVAEALGASALEWALFGGEDYELAFTAPAERVDRCLRAVRATGVPCHVIGTVVEEPGVWLVRGDGVRERIPARGWDHLSPPS